MTLSALLINDNHRKVNKIKFHSDYNINGVTFVRNSVYEYIDKHQEYIEDDCLDCNKLVWIYRIDVNGIRYSINGEYVVEFLDPEDVYVKDYTKEQWDEKITTDAMVNDGDYVTTWKKTYNINKPVKDRIEQTDYDSEWIETKKQMDEYFTKETSKDRSNSLSP